MTSKPPTIPFGIVACTFSDNLSRNSCIYAIRGPLHGLSKNENIINAGCWVLLIPSKKNQSVLIAKIGSHKTQKIAISCHRLTKFTWSLGNLWYLSHIYTRTSELDEFRLACVCWIFGLNERIYLSTGDVHVALMMDHYNISTPIKIYELHGTVSWTCQTEDEGSGWGSVQLFHSQPKNVFRIGVRKSTGKAKGVSWSIFLQFIWNGLLHLISVPLVEDLSFLRTPQD